MHVASASFWESCSLIVVFHVPGLSTISIIADVKRRSPDLDDGALHSVIGRFSVISFGSRSRT